MRMTIKEYQEFLNAGEKAPKRSKYSAKRAYRCLHCDSIVPDHDRTRCPVCRSQDVAMFDSRGEARRWDVLRQEERLGAITGLRRQVRYDLHAPAADGGRVRLGYYLADFLYLRAGADAYTVEDFKSVPTMTAASRWKIRHFQAEYGLKVNIVKKGKAP